MPLLNPELPAYSAVNMVRYRMKKTEIETDKKQIMTKEKTDTTSINFHRKEIICIVKTQKEVLTVSINRYDEVIISRRCSEPTTGVVITYCRLKYNFQPFTKRKFVVHKSESEKMDVDDLQRLVT